MQVFLHPLDHFFLYFVQICSCGLSDSLQTSHEEHKTRWLDNPRCMDLFTFRCLASTCIPKIQLCHVCCDSELLYSAVVNLVFIRKHLPRGSVSCKMDWVRVDRDQTGANSFDRDWCIHSLLGAIFHHQHSNLLLWLQDM